MSKNNLLSTSDNTIIKNINQVIMIVDDDKSFLFLLKKYLTYWGYQRIYTASSGNNAVKCFNNLECKPSIILTDYLMPDGDGLYLAREIKKICQDVIIVMITSDFKLTYTNIKKHGISFLIKKLEDNVFLKLKNILVSIKDFQE
ncbi:MAG: response regulator transcription factor [Promethearchaeota archaeon]